MNAQTDYFDKATQFAKRMQEPLQAIIDLNMKTLQSMSVMKPDELSKVKKPEDFFEKQVQFALSNGHRTLEYMQKVFEISEKAMLGFVRDTATKTETKAKR